MLNREFGTIAAIMISIPVTFSPFQAQGSLRIDQGWGSCYDCPVQPAGANMTGAAGNATGGTHDSSLHTTNPAAYSTHDSRPSMRNVK